MHQTLGEQLRARRKEKGLTLEQVGKACKVNPSFISQIETGKRSANAQILESLLTVLNLGANNLAPNNAGRYKASKSEVLGRISDLIDRTSGYLEMIDLATKLPFPTLTAIIVREIWKGKPK